jgi:hypothetical protein
MGMKTRARIALLAIVGIATIALFSCAPAPVSIEDRISEFVSSLNGDRSDTYTNLDPGTAAYGEGKIASFWDTAFDVRANAPFTYTPKSPDTSDPSDVEITVNDSAGFVGLYKFVMRNIGDASDNWVIKDILVHNGVFETIFI